MTDSIVHKIRGIREQHAASFGFDFYRISTDLQARQNKHTDEGWTIIPLPLVRRPRHCSEPVSLAAKFERDVAHNSTDNA